MPRSRALCARVLARHAPWWGFAFYIAVWIAAATVVVALSLVNDEPPADVLVVSSWIGRELIAVAIISPGLVWFVRRRRGRVRALAERGTLTSAAITSIGSTAPLDMLVGRHGASGVVVWVEVGRMTYRAMVAGNPSWAQVGVPVELVRTPGVPYAVVILPDGRDILARERDLDLYAPVA